MNSEYVESAAHRNGYIDLLRFLASIGIVLFHFGTKGSLKFYNGGLFVEFFFMLTGHYAVKSIDDKLRFCDGMTNVDSLIFKYMTKWYLKVLPFVFWGCLLLYIYQFFFVQLTPVARFMRVFLFFMDVLLFECTGAMHTSSAYVLWYLSATIICLPVLLYIFTKSKPIFSYIALILPWVSYGYILAHVGTLRTNAFNPCLFLRTFSGLSLGGGVFLASSFLKAHRLNRWGVKIASSLEIIALLSAVLLTMVRAIARSRYDSIFVLLVFFSLTLSMSGLTYTNRLNNAFCSWLAKLSLPVYCSHWGVYTLASRLGLGIYDADWKIWTALFIVIVLSSAQIVLNSQFGRIIKRDDICD